jgi:hypothetical protein
VIVSWRSESRSLFVQTRHRSCSWRALVAPEGVSPDSSVLAPKQRRLPRHSGEIARATVVSDNTTARTPSTNIRPSRKATSVTNETPPHPTSDKPSQPSGAASVERNKAVSRRWIEVFNERDDAAEAHVRRQGYVAYAPVSLEPTPLDSEAWTRFLGRLRRGFS